MTTIGPSVVIRGEISSQEDLTIEGHVYGDVIVRDAELTIAPSAQVDADVRGLRISVLGAVTGNLSASERIHLVSSAHVNGTLSANHVVIDDGAVFNGRVDMDQRTIAAKVARYRAEHTAAR